jgi:HD-GYP domain-containing protein (c-di-GMP phosphodiesterase class II)
MTNSSDLTLAPDPFTRVPCSDLVVGMFVAELDRPWKDTPFPINGFHIRRIEDLEALRRFCKHVVIDVSRGKAPKKMKPRELTILSSARKRAPAASAIAVRHDVYPITRSVKQEIDSLEQAYEALAKAFGQVIANARDEKPLGLTQLATPQTALLDSLCRCPDAAVWFLNTQSQRDAQLQHCLRAAIWAVLLGRHIGLTREELDTLLQGTLLADIGLARFPPSLVTKSGPFSRKEYLAYQKHVRIGEDILRVDGEASAQVINILRNHHERHDGRGFPRGQQGEQIPLLARIAHLAYSYDRLLKPFNARQPVVPATAVSRLYKQRMLKFMEQLVFEFIQSLGMYPAGSLVEVASHEVAVVVEQNPGEKLQPRLAVLLDAEKKPLTKVRLVNPVEDRSSALAMAITKALPPGSYGIDVNSLREQIFGKRIAIGKFGIRF